MNILSNISSSLQSGFKFKKVALFILLIQLFLSVLIGILSYNYIQGSIGHSVNLLKIIDGYNHDVFQDLLHSESTGWLMIKIYMAIVILIYLLIGPFIMGGLLNCYKKNRDKWITFWLGGSKYYRSFLKLNLIISVIVIISLVLFILLVVMITNYGMQNFLTEIPTLISWLTLLILFVMIVILMVSISTKAKWEIMNKRMKIRTAFKSGFRMVFRNAGHFLLIGFCFLLLTFIFIVAVNYIINIVPESGFLLVLLALFFQIFALFVRVLIRNGYYHALINAKV